MNYGEKSPVGQGFLEAVTAATTKQAGFCSDVACNDGWKVALMYDSSLDASAVAASTLPTARWLSQGANDIAVMRSGWGPDDTYVWMSCGDYFGAHGHDEAGSFQVFRHGMLTGPTGGYDGFDTKHFDDYYSQHSVHANTIAVYEPMELFPTAQTIANGLGQNVNDGGQRVLRRTDDKGVIGAYPPTDLATYKKYKTTEPFYETGNLETFEHATCHDYVACDVTAAYDSAGFTTDGNMPKVKEVSRQLVFVRPEVVIVFDRVEALDMSFEKRFLLHASGTGVMPKVSGSSFTIDNGGGRLLGQTLLPAAATINVVTNWSVAGTPYPPDMTALPNEPELGGNRLEIVPKQPATRDYFLHVLDATDPSKSSLPATVMDATDTATVTIQNGSNTYVVSFNKTGLLGGHIKVTGAMNCEENLGAMGTMGTGGSSASGASGATSTSAGSSTGGASAGAGGGGTGGSSGSPGKKGGCGCIAAGESDGALAPLVGALLALLRRRPRRR
jgi:MYXO-CTERM domain-containing protein